METNPKEYYVCPTVNVVEVKTELVTLAGSLPDYFPEEW